MSRTFSHKMHPSLPPLIVPASTPCWRFVFLQPRVQYHDTPSTQQHTPTQVHSLMACKQQIFRPYSSNRVGLHTYAQKMRSQVKREKGESELMEQSRKLTKH